MNNVKTQKYHLPLNVAVLILYGVFICSWTPSPTNMAHATVESEEVTRPPFHLVPYHSLLSAMLQPVSGAFPYRRHRTNFHTSSWSRNQRSRGSRRWRS